MSGFNAATAFKPWRTCQSGKVPGARRMLQCGHGLQAVENILFDQRLAIEQHGFNAATAFKPWRTDQSALMTWLHKCFNAATAFKPWRT